MDPKIKWWKLEEEELKVLFQERVLEAKEAKKKVDLSRQEQDIENYKQAKKEARRAVAKAKAEPSNEVYEKMETPEREKKILRIAKARDAASKDLTQIRQIKDSNDIVLAEENEAKR
ncbi:MAP7 domain-containing protein 2-like [Palaemon carinicauda]|uniref:MAP7 domain-containing protein 2-like n=1 Tax=Palaemon carinicauda TaxID=392227 RepID=UPI0035B61739